MRDRPGAGEERGLAGLRVLVVEDESLICMLIEDMLADIGCTVAAIASELDDATSKISKLSFDAAILDVNLNGSQTYPAAEALTQKHIPFVFSTGYGAAGIPEMFRGVPTIEKPFQESDLRKALTAALARQS